MYRPTPGTQCNASALLTRVLASLLVLVMFASACGGDGDVETVTDAVADADSATGSAPEARAEGSSDDRSPVSDSDDRAEVDDAVSADVEDEAPDDGDVMADDDAMFDEEEAMDDASDWSSADEEPATEAASAEASAERSATAEPLSSAAEADVTQPQPQPGLLTAGDVDDNLNYDFFLGYLNRTADELGQRFPAADLTDRVVVEVTDSTGRAVANAPVTFSHRIGGRQVVVHTNGAGVAHFFPYLKGDHGTDFTVSAGGASAEVDVTSRQGTISLAASELDGGAPDALDVAFVLDVTGSMSDELNYLTVEFESIIERLQRTYPGASLRFGLVVYRDHGDEFVSRAYDFTDDVDEMQERLAEQQAYGGGDYPEAMDEALADANDLGWRDGNVARVMIVNADAPPHDNRVQETLQAAETATGKGVRIYPLAASGVGDGAEYLMRIMAATSGGRHLFLTADSGIGGEKQEPKTPCYQVTSLDSLLLRVFETELAGERIEANPAEVIRTVGTYDRGVCGQ